MRVGFDLHGVIDLYPKVFQDLGEKLIQEGHSIHIITGQSWEQVKDKVEKYEIPYTNHFSTVDYHKKLGTKMWQDDKGTWWLDQELWLRSKGSYVTKEHIDVHFDDTLEYARFFPNYCTFVLVPKFGFDKFIYVE
jgi:hypothetical protein